MTAVQPPQLRPPLLRPPSSSSTLHPSTSLPIPSSSRSGLPPPAKTSSLQSSTPAPRRVPVQAGGMTGAQPPLTAGGAVRKVSGGAKATETPAEGQRTLRRPGRVLQAVAEREGGETTGSSTLKRSTSGLPPPTSSTIRTLSSSTSLRTFPTSTSSIRTLPSSSSLTIPEASSPQTPRTRARSRSIASQALQRSLSRSASGRRLSSRRQEAEGEQEDGDATVKPARRVLPPSSSRVEKGKNPETASPRKKPALSGLGRPAPPPPSAEGDISLSLATARKPSSTLRSISASSSLSASTQQKTPLRTSTRRPSRGGSAAAEGEMKPPPPPSASVASSSRTLPRRVLNSAVPASSIPVAGRVLKKPTPPAPSSVASDASTVTAGSSVASVTADAAMRRSRADGRMGGPPGLQSGKPRSSAAGGTSKIPPRPRSSYVSQSQTRHQQQQPVEGGRRDSWVTESEPGSARPSLSGMFEPLPEAWDGQRSSALPFPSTSAADSSAFATPRKPSASSSAAADPSLLVSPPPSDGAGNGLPPTRASLSYVSPDGSSRSRTIYLSPSSAAASPPISALLSSSSLSPSTPSTGLLTHGPRPRQVSLFRRRNKPRESASLEEILRLGLQTHAAGGDGGGARELELLLDEGSSALMREDLEGVETGGVGGGTPWRGRVLSLSVSSAGGHAGSPRGGRRGSVLVHPPPEEEEGTAQEGGQGDEQDQDVDEHGEQQLLVLPLRPSTHEAASLRREIASLQAELSSLRRQSSLAHPPPPFSPGGAQKEEEEDRVAALEEELQEQRERMDRMEEEHRAEVEAMEADLAALAVGASLAQPVPPPAPAPQPSSSFAHALTLAKLQLDLSSALSSSASLAASTAYKAVEARARRERDHIRGEVESLRCLMGGLKGWEGVLQGVCG